MEINYYIHEEGGFTTYFIEFKKLGVLLIFQDKIEPVERFTMTPNSTIFEAGIPV